VFFLTNGISFIQILGCGYSSICVVYILSIHYHLLLPQSTELCGAVG